MGAPGRAWSQRILRFQGRFFCGQASQVSPPPRCSSRMGANPSVPVAQHLLRGCEIAENGRIPGGHLNDPDVSWPKVLDRTVAHLKQFLDSLDTLLQSLRLDESPGLRETVERHFPRSRQVRSLNESAVQLEISLPEIEGWASKIAADPRLGIRLYEELEKLHENPEPDTPLWQAKRRLCLVLFYIIRELFKKRFYAKGKLDPLAWYICKHLDGQTIAVVSKKGNDWAAAGKRLSALAKAVSPSVPLLLPKDITPSRQASPLKPSENV